MKHIAAVLIALSLSAPANAEEAKMDDLLKQFEDLSNNAQTLLEGWVEQLGPTLEGFADKIEDMSAYHPPEVLENGDIIIRRKTPIAPAPEQTPQPEDMTADGTIDL